MSILHKGQSGLQAFKLSNSIGVCDKLLYQAQILSPLWTLCIFYPLEQLQGFFITVQSSFPHLNHTRQKPDQSSRQGKCAVLEGGAQSNKQA